MIEDPRKSMARWAKQTEPMWLRLLKQRAERQTKSLTERHLVREYRKPTVTSPPQSSADSESKFNQPRKSTHSSAVQQESLSTSKTIEYGRASPEAKAALDRALARRRRGEPMWPFNPRDTLDYKARIEAQRMTRKTKSR